MSSRSTSTIFAAVIRGEAEPLVTCRDGLQNLRVAEAIAECGWVVGASARLRMAMLWAFEPVK